MNRDNAPKVVFIPKRNISRDQLKAMQNTWKRLFRQERRRWKNAGGIAVMSDDFSVRDLGFVPRKYNAASVDAE